ncbi:Type IV secretory pathway, VirJ component [Pseudomonas cuatrocienegasensis]|uniref:Type IV secretory pathway, VirJ component n=1 Tax=Pseudomonas cuatrocienegasensis TaxID=543360 RepID=A0ABY1B490_9PSED|nr:MULTISPECIES: AcvB/VirJ family lysyl-phosphatidylglycerol hydrolase [Pseudomonas]OEC37197.1 virulence factor family protein [Pseudomonas sp. 21C1]SEP88640.1 Type IV secretory pathway, VirJ component [Pseudomonas cuatrocienegasensis]
MQTRTPRAVLLLLIALLLGGALAAWLLTRSPAQAELRSLQLADGSQLTVAEPAGTPRQRVLLALTAEQAMTPTALMALAESSGARLAQLQLPANDCALQAQRLQQASTALDGPVDLIAGIGPGAALAWRWLAEQSSDQAQALSIGFSLQQPDCATPLPEQAAHGRWHVAWNNNPDDASARFAREQANADTQISDYSTSLEQLLQSQLQRLLNGQAADLPVVEVVAKPASADVALFYSGDGGWRDLDRDLAAELAKRGQSVVGIDSLRYFWQHKSPEQGAQDLSRLMHDYQAKWGATRFTLIGFSFGADALPAFYNRLPAEDQQRVEHIILIAAARSGSFEIEVQGWLGKAGSEAATGPELRKLPADKLLCIYGSEEAPQSGCTLPNLPGEQLQISGGHHLDGNYAALAEHLLSLP